MNLKTAFLIGRAYNKILWGDDMNDIERVKKGLQCIIDGTVRCESCGYSIDGYGHMSCTQDCAKDALALLKEDCHNCKLECLLQKYDELKEKYDALLKEQEESIPVSWLKEKLEGHPELSYAVTDGINNVLDLWEGR